MNSKIYSLPKGSIKKRRIHGNSYYYVQYRNKNKIVQKYLGRELPEELAKRLKERKILKGELKKCDEALKIIKRSKGKRVLKNA